MGDNKIKRLEDITGFIQVLMEIIPRQKGEVKKSMEQTLQRYALEYQQLSGREYNFNIERRKI